MIKKSRYVKNRKELGINLKLARRQAKITQTMASSSIGLNRSCLAHYELGKNLPSIFTLIKLSEIYNIELLNLLVT